MEQINFNSFQVKQSTSCSIIEKVASGGDTLCNKCRRVILDSGHWVFRAPSLIQYNKFSHRPFPHIISSRSALMSAMSAALDSRNRRNLLAHSMNAFSPPFHKNYSTGTTAEMKTAFGDSLYINTVHLIPEPIKMNLADSVVPLDEKKLKTNMADTKVNKSFNVKDSQSTKNDYYPSLAGITNFFSGVFNVMGAMFQKRADSPVQYYDCFEQGFEDNHQMTPSSPAWHGAKHEDQNIHGRAQTDEFANETYTDFSTDMSKDFRSIAAHCEDKLNQVRLLLTNPQLQKTVRTRRPKRAFHEADSVEELFEDAFNSEDFISLANETFLEYCSPFSNHQEEVQMVQSPKVKTETMPVKESMEIVQSISSKECCEVKNTTPLEQVEDILDTDVKRQVVLSCEDKVSQLKALLQRRCTVNTNVMEPKLIIPTKSVDAHETSPIPIPNQPENPNCTEVVFSKDIEFPLTPDSPCVLDPCSYFDEVTGRFYSSSATDSEDSFQIVFADSPRNGRKCLSSDCESEDSFIVFEESPDSCYTSNDVFGDDANITTHISDSDASDSDCESDLDSGVSTIALSHSLTRTFGDLTDGSLYEDSKGEDVVDCAFRSGAEIPQEMIDNERVTTTDSQDHKCNTKRSLLLDDTRKRERKKIPAKKVHFSPLPPKVHVMRVWAFAARQARAGHWERHALDRERFKRRIADVEMAISWVLKPQHRSRVMFQRFMPWWNAQKRKELAEQKQREERSKQEKEQGEELLKDPATVNESDRNEAGKTQIADRMGKKELVGQLQNIQEDTEVRIELESNGDIDVNCIIDSVTNSKEVVKSVNNIAKNIHRGEKSLQDNICIGDERDTLSHDTAVNNTGQEQLCNRYVDNVSEDQLIEHRQIIKKNNDQLLELRNKINYNDHCAVGDVKSNGDVAIQISNVLKGGMDTEQCQNVLT